MWYFLLHSGVHATLAGVLLAFAVPFGKGDESSPSFVLQHKLHKLVAFVILPIFALANTAITLDHGFLAEITREYGIGIIAGLVAGKPLGIFIFSWIAVKAGISEKPVDIRWPHILGLGFLGGIGFTMSIFILLLAFDDNAVINNSKAAILIGSFVAGLTGYLLLKKFLKKDS
jgi:NhaA family Na+:H+ antiporter